MLTSTFDYDLPERLIAQEPVEPRDAARLLVADTSTGQPSHHRVSDLVQFLAPGDLVVLNHTRVIPARLFAKKESGGEVEVLLIHPEPTSGDKNSDDNNRNNSGTVVCEGEGKREVGSERWRCLIRRRVHVGTRLMFDGVGATVETLHDDGERSVRFDSGLSVLALAERTGHIPLPPYIRRADRPEDRQRYQTVFADRPGSVAAPTASLHLTPQLIEQLRQHGVEFARVDLAIGPGTFKPVASEHVADHRIHAEHCECPAATIAAIQRCRARGGRVIAIGTTVVRTLESAAAQPGGLAAFHGWTRIFLHPPQRLAVVDGLMTNFHLPRSSLMMLVACLTGVERLHDLYRAAIAADYRFYSYGDAMLILPGLPQPSPSPSRSSAPH